MKLDELPEVKYQKLITFLDEHSDEVFSLTELHSHGFSFSLHNTSEMKKHIGDERMVCNPTTRRRWIGCPEIVSEYKKRLGL